MVSGCRYACCFLFKVFRLNTSLMTECPEAVWTAGASCCNFAHTDASRKWSAPWKTTDVRQALKRGRWNPRGLGFEVRLKVEEEIAYISYSTALTKRTRLLFVAWCGPVLYVLLGCSKVIKLFSWVADRWRAARVCEIQESPVQQPW